MINPTPNHQYETLAKTTKEIMARFPAITPLIESLGMLIFPRGEKLIQAQHLTGKRYHQMIQQFT